MPSETRKYRITSGSYTGVVDGETRVFIAGTSNDVLDLTPKTARRLGPSFVLIEGQEPVPDPETIAAGEAAERAYKEFLAQPVEVIEKTLPTMHDPVVLAAVYNLEGASSKPRNEVLEAIKARYGEIQEEHSRA